MTAEKRISLGVGSIRFTADREDVERFEWRVKLLRLFNTKSLIIKVWPSEPEPFFYPGKSLYEMDVEEHKKIFFLHIHLRTEKYNLILAEGDNLKEKVGKKLNEVYVGNWFKRFVLLRASG
jgi:hypothetical protein